MRIGSKPSTDLDDDGDDDGGGGGVGSGGGGVDGVDGDGDDGDGDGHRRLGRLLRERGVRSDTFPRLFFAVYFVFVSF